MRGRSLEDDFSAVPAGSVNLDSRGGRRHDDDRRRAQGSCGERDGLAVVA